MVSPGKLSARGSRRLGGHQLGTEISISLVQEFLGCIHSLVMMLTVLIGIPRSVVGVVVGVLLFWLLFICGREGYSAREGGGSGGGLDRGGQDAGHWRGYSHGADGTEVHRRGRAV